MKNKLWLWVGIPVAIILLVIFWYIGTYNSLIRLNEQVSNKWAQVETQYQRRVDLIPNLVSTVKGAAGFEQKTLEDITNARSQWQAAINPEQKVAAANNVESALARLLVVVENYPQLKAKDVYEAMNYAQYRKARMFLSNPVLAGHYVFKLWKYKGTLAFLEEFIQKMSFIRKAIFMKKYKEAH